MIANNDILFNAAGYAGQKEVDGPNSNLKILDWINWMFPGWKDDSTLAWCSVFMNMVAENVCAESPKQNGHPTPGMARSWLTVGEEIDDPMPGDICILWRGTPGGKKGHVGIYYATVGDRLLLFGGNQGNAVTLSSYSKKRVLGFRRLRITEH